MLYREHTTIYEWGDKMQSTAKSIQISEHQMFISVIGPTEKFSEKSFLIYTATYTNSKKLKREIMFIKL